MLNLIEQYLKNCLSTEDETNKNVLYEAVRYSLLDAGKRVRPTLCLEFCKLCGEDIKKALPFAAAVEMIHTYSLIHDDLPCMDNDEMRRGKPTNHKVYGEDMALLAGDALLTKAFEVALSSEIESEKVVKATKLLAEYAGTKGMVGGQCIDLSSEGKDVSLDVLKQMNIEKTCALIKASCQMGAVVAGASEKEVEAAGVYAENLGMAFQIRDDVLDLIGDAKELGKNTGMDKTLEKCNYLSLLGLEKCTQLVDDYTQKAIEALSIFSGDTSFAKNLAIKMKERTN